jgi:uncharacterized protein with HEPN domain
LPSKHLHLRLQDILDNIDSIQRYTLGLDEKSFTDNKLVSDAVERCLGRISEAASKIGKLADVLAPGQPWKKIRGFGNVLRHDYGRVRGDLVWEIVLALPSLREACAKALASLDPKGK